MINEKSLSAVKKSTFSSQFCKPLYQSYCFSRIPATIKSLLGKPDLGRLPTDTTGNASDYDVVIVFLIDGFGWRFFEKYHERYPFLNRFIKEGIASKITSQFPSTTAAHVTCMNTGLPCGQTGVYEWFYYEPKIDCVIAPLLFSFAGDKETETLNNKISAKDIYPKKTFYQDLHNAGIASFVIQHQSIAESTYSTCMLKGATRLPYFRFSQGLSHILQICKEKDVSKSYINLYFGDIDGMGHRYGIDSPEFNKAVDECFSTLEDVFASEISKIDKKIATIVIADHGMVAVDPKTTFYLNEKIPEIKEMIQKNKKGDLIAPVGSCRDFFLHIQDIYFDEACALLKQKLHGIAEIYPTAELIKQNFFCEGPVSKVFLERVGNLVILPLENEAVWWREPHRFDQHFFGSHGGLAPGEMETIFLFQGQ